MDKMEVSQVLYKHSLSVTREAQAGSVSKGRKVFIGLFWSHLAQGPCHPPFFSVLFQLCTLPRLRPGLNGRAVGNPFGKPVLKNGNRKYIPPRLRRLSLTINCRTANVTVKTPIRGSDVPTNFRSKKCSLV